MSNVWAVVDSGGAAEVRSVSMDRQQAIQQFLALAASNGGDGKTWPEYEKSGYACNPFALVAAETNKTTSGQSDSGDDHA